MNITYVLELHSSPLDELRPGISCPLYPQQYLLDLPMIVIIMLWSHAVMLYSLDVVGCIGKYAVMYCGMFVCVQVSMFSTTSLFLLILSYIPLFHSSTLKFLILFLCTYLLHFIFSYVLSFK